jgi:hypothetical protein
MPVPYPFSAVVGCEADVLDDMGLALVLTTIAPDIGGVLVRGEKGTAKSTAVRGTRRGAAAGRRRSPSTGSASTRRPRRPLLTRRAVRPGR